MKIENNHIYKIYHRERMNDTEILQPKEFIRRMKLIVSTSAFMKGYNTWCRNNDYSITIIGVNHYLSYLSQHLDIPVSKLIEMKKDYEINYRKYFTSLYFHQKGVEIDIGDEDGEDIDIKDLENLNIAIAIGVFRKHTGIALETILKSLEDLYPVVRLHAITREYRNKVVPMFYAGGVQRKSEEMNQ